MAKGDKSTSRRAPKETTKKIKKKVCLYCIKKIDYIDYKDVDPLKKFMSERGKIRARRVSGNCDQHQRAIANAIKNAREMALLPYTQRMVAERTSLRGPKVDRSEKFEAPVKDQVAVESIEEVEMEEAN
jgi:ribosomal protein S18